MQQRLRNRDRLAFRLCLCCCGCAIRSTREESRASRATAAAVFRPGRELEESWNCFTDACSKTPKPRRSLASGPASLVPRSKREVSTQARRGPLSKGGAKPGPRSHTKPPRTQRSIDSIKQGLLQKCSKSTEDLNLIENVNRSSAKGLESPCCGCCKLNQGLVLVHGGDLRV